MAGGEGRVLMDSPFSTIVHDLTKGVQPLSESTCPSCRAEGRIIGTSLGADVYQCPSCELCYLAASIRPNSDNDNHWYEEMLDLPDGEQFVRMMGKAYKHQLEALSRLTPGKRLVDVGCGVGVFLAVAKREGWDAYGVESSEHSAKFARKYYNLTYHSTLAELTDASFDVVRISHVLEHIPEPVGFLKELRRLLKPGGVLAITVPNREPLTCLFKNKLKHLRSARPSLSGAIYPDMHVLGFSPKSLTRLLGQSGFRRVRVHTVSMGKRTFYPFFFDGLLQVEKLIQIPPGRLIRFFLPKLIDNLGNPFGRGDWIVGYFKES